MRSPERDLWNFEACGPHSANEDRGPFPLRPEIPLDRSVYLTKPPGEEITIRMKTDTPSLVGPTNSRSTVSTLDRLERRLADLVRTGGPDSSEYDDLNDQIHAVWTTCEDDRARAEAAARLQSALPEDFLIQTVHGHGLAKPMGYAGDFLMIDKIYVEEVTPLPQYQRWDQYFQAHAAPNAVRGRKDYFKSIVQAALDAAGGPIRILNLGTGPGRDLAEFLQDNPHAPVQITSVDLDARASRFARTLVGASESRVEFVTENALRFWSEDRFDLVWSAGLFDYLNDRLFVGLLRRAGRLLAEGGEVVVGNFSPANPSRAYMELLGDWHLLHRSAEELRELGVRAGFSAEGIRVGSEPLGVNLFLHLGIGPIHGKSDGKTGAIRDSQTGMRVERAGGHTST